MQGSSLQPADIANIHIVDRLKDAGFNPVAGKYKLFLSGKTNFGKDLIM